MPVAPALEKGDRWMPRAHWPTSLAEKLSVRNRRWSIQEIPGCPDRLCVCMDSHAYVHTPHTYKIYMHKEFLYILYALESSLWQGREKGKRKKQSLESWAQDNSKSNAVPVVVQNPMVGTLLTGSATSALQPQPSSPPACSAEIRTSLIMTNDIALQVK